MSACGDRQRSSSWRRFWYATWKVASCFGPEGPSGSTAFSKVEALGRVSHELFQTEFAEGKAHVDARLRDVGQWEGELVHRKRNGERLVVASQQNVARHSKAGKVWVHLDVQDGMLVLGVEDDGVGISPESLGQSQSLRLLGMRERAAILGGQVEIAGIPGKGTTVIVRMPIQ
jgi:signal transduction histidine kinase